MSDQITGNRTLWTPSRRNCWSVPIGSASSWPVSSNIDSWVVDATAGVAATAISAAMRSRAPRSIAARGRELGNYFSVIFTDRLVVGASGSK